MLVKLSTLENNTGNCKSKYNTHYFIKESTQAIWNTINITIHITLSTEIEQTNLLYTDSLLKSSNIYSTMITITDDN